MTFKNLVLKLVLEAVRCLSVLNPEERDDEITTLLFIFILFILLSSQNISFANLKNLRKLIYNNNLKINEFPINFLYLANFYFIFPLFIYLYILNYKRSKFTNIYNFFKKINKNKK